MPHDGGNAVSIAVHDPAARLMAWERACVDLSMAPTCATARRTSSGAASKSPHATHDVGSHARRRTSHGWNGLKRL